MNKLIDTHAHIYLNEFENDIHEVIRESKNSGIEKIFMPNIDSTSIESMLMLDEQYNGYCIPMMGLHPCYVKENHKEEIDVIEYWLKKRDFCAIGEVGIDLYWDKTYLNQQVHVFETQINWSKELGLPLIIHCRDSLNLTIDIVEKHQNGNLKGIFHCFTGNINQANKIIDLNFMLGIGGVATFKNGGLDKVIPNISMDHLVLETDSPYLAPTPFRGKRNKPVYLQNIANRVAELKMCEITEVARQTTINACNVFGNG